MLGHYHLSHVILLIAQLIRKLIRHWKISISRPGNIYWKEVTWCGWTERKRPNCVNSTFKLMGVKAFYWSVTSAKMSCWFYLNIRYFVYKEDLAIFCLVFLPSWCDRWFWPRAHPSLILKKIRQNFTTWLYCKLNTPCQRFSHPHAKTCKNGLQFTSKSTLESMGINFL